MNITDTINYSKKLGDKFEISFKPNKVNVIKNNTTYMSFNTGENIEIEVVHPNENYYKFREDLMQLMLKYTRPLEYKVSQESDIQFYEASEIILSLMKLGMKEDLIEQFYDTYNFKVLCMIENLLRCGDKVEDIMIFLSNDED